MERAAPAFFQVKLNCVCARLPLANALSGMTPSDVNKATPEIFILLQNNASALTLFHTGAEAQDFETKTRF